MTTNDFVTLPIADLVAHSQTLSRAEQIAFALTMVDMTPNHLRLHQYLEAIPKTVRDMMLSTVKADAKRHADEIKNRYLIPLTEKEQELVTMFHLPEMGLRYYFQAGVCRFDIEGQIGFGTITLLNENVSSITMQIKGGVQYVRSINSVAFTWEQNKPRLAKEVREFIRFCALHQIQGAVEVERKCKTTRLLGNV